MPRILHRLVLPSFRGALSQHLPVLSLQAAAPGPCALVTANVHGDEATGIGAVHLLLDRLESCLRRGHVFLYPSLNLTGLVQNSRTLPADGQDLNRQFPGDPRGTASERHAHAIWKDLVGREPDLLIDLHADSPASIPYALVDRVVQGDPRRADVLEGRAESLAQATGLTVLREYPRAEYKRYHLDRSLTGAMLNRERVPSVTVEAGPRLYIDPEAAEVAVNAVLGALGQFGLVEETVISHPSWVPGGPWRRKSGPRASESGVFHPLVPPGQPFKLGQALAQIRALDGRVLETLHATEVGVVIALPERAWVSAGVSAGTYAVRDG